jgi:hypothetical protein
VPVRSDAEVAALGHQLTLFTAEFDFPTLWSCLRWLAGKLRLLHRLLAVLAGVYIPGPDSTGWPSLWCPDIRTPDPLDTRLPVFACAP